jgi:hypothetical protein
MISTITDYLAIVSVEHLHEMHYSLLGYWPRNDGRIVVLSRVRKALSEHGAPWFNRYRAALGIASSIATRWRAEGARRWRRDLHQLPVPCLPDEAPLEHRWAFAFEVSPSGKALFECVHCDMATTPMPRSTGQCRGRAMDAVHSDLAFAVFGGAAYAPDTNGNLRPTRADMWACACCGHVGPWTAIDPIGRETVCPRCLEETRTMLRSPKHSARAATLHWLPEFPR